MRRLGVVLVNSLLTLQILLIVTGGAVRLSKSGLGCPTWPECTNGSIAPVAGQAEGVLHSWIEYGNRLITVAMVLVALVTFVWTIRFGSWLVGSRPDRSTLDRSTLDESKRIKALAAGQILGIFGQIILGGISVLTKLNPIPVAGHFLLSIALVTGAVSLRARVMNIPTMNVEALSLALGRIVMALALAVIAIGTIVTGSGPHAGDPQAPRFGFDPRTVAWIHADVVIALLTLTIATVIIIRYTESQAVRSSYGKALRIFLFIGIAQGAIGYIQYFTKLPEIIVGAHMAGAALLWTSICNVAWKGKLLQRTKG